MSTATIPSPPPADHASAPGQHPEADLDGRWTAWKVRGVAHERIVRRRLLSSPIAAGIIALAAVIFYSLLAS